MKPLHGTIKRAAWHALAFASLIALAVHWQYGKPSADAIMYAPDPDAQEQTSQAISIAQGKPPLIAIGNELQPARWSPAHPAIVALWIILNGGNVDAIYSYASVAILIGAVCLYFFMGSLRIGAPLRWPAIAMLVFSPLFYRLSWGLFQEPTLFMLFGLSLLLWREKGWRQIVVGFLCGWMFCIRGTYLFWPLFMPLLGRWRLRPLAASAARLGLGFVACILLNMTFNYFVTGMWMINGYHYWEDARMRTWSIQWDGLSRFSLFQPFHRPDCNNCPETTLQLLKIDFLGLKDTITSTHWQGMATLFALAAISPFLTRRSMVRRRLIVLELFFLSQLTIHLFLYCYASRYFVCAWAATIACATASVGAIIGRIKAKPWLFLVVCLVVMALCPGFRPPFFPPENVDYIIKAAKAKKEALMALAREENCQCPMFVQSFLPATVQLLFRADQPVFTITGDKMAPYYNADMFLAKGVKPSRKHVIESRSLSGRPFDIWLYDPKTKAINEKLISDIIREHKAMVVLTWRDGFANLNPLIRYLQREYKVARHDYGKGTLIKVEAIER